MHLHYHGGLSEAAQPLCQARIYKEERSSSLAALLYLAPQYYGVLSRTDVYIILWRGF